MDYISINDQEKKEMFSSIGVSKAEDLFSVIPEKAKVKGLNLPKGLSEQELVSKFEILAGKNISLKQMKSFRGAGIYEHFIPSLVDEITGRSEFLTAYTPYQAEASQGTLQTIFEYQSLITQLTGLDVANASMYDGASALAEAALVSIRSTGKKKLLVSSALHPEYFQVLKTYLQGLAIDIKTIPLDGGNTSTKDLKNLFDPDTASVIIQSPNFFGQIEDLEEIKKLCEPAGFLLISVVNPISLGILKSPGEAGSDICVGEGQVLGNPSGMGGFTFGFMSCKQSLAWKMPGRIVGQTTDTKGRRGFVLTLQSREQHIRREKATSNICTNSALNALAGCVYLSGWGPEGFKKLSTLNLSKSRYAFEEIIKIKGFSAAFSNHNFFNEFVIKTTKDVNKLQSKLLDEKILGPLELEKFFPEFKNCLLFCVTEARTKKDIDKLVDILKEC
ncbi:MAG: aminomethyl-transferring glycine dehydrogenase subunit GcvPA [Elusimicrobia bacterium]|nr:aminomethyl-transferring glycine dehydrogenase subunit GcvPA [Elusimicrobiota bacterium]